MSTPQCEQDRCDRNATGMNEGGMFLCDEHGDWLAKVQPFAGMSHVDEPCHCGRQVAYGFDGDFSHTRGLCRRCDMARCDAYPMECPYSQDHPDRGAVSEVRPTGEVSRRIAGMRLILENQHESVMAASRQVKDERAAANLRGKAAAYRDALRLVRALEQGHRMPWRKGRSARRFRQVDAGEAS